MKLNARHIGFLLSMLFCTAMSHAQLRVQPIGKRPIETSSQSRTLATRDTISLPFWDDFSFSAVAPDTTLWESNTGVYVNGTLGKVSPTINVASFDGNDLVGNPHNPQGLTSEEADVLTSQPINLAAVAVDKRSSVYLSFYWQMEGQGEIPEQKDSLKLDFKNVNGEWINVFELVGEEENLSETFTKQAILIDNESYFHEGFQFRFRSIGNTQGPFDAWHIDYVYLNQDRTIANESIIDRAVASELTSIFSQYTMIPYDVVFGFPDTIYNSVNVEISTLQNNIHPVLFSYTVRDTLLDMTLLDMPSTTGPPLINFGRNTISTQSLNSANLMAAATDSLFLESRLILETSDDFFISEINGSDTTYLVDNNYNYRLNDTIRRYHQVHQALAYDDGQAEYAAGLNKNEAQIAVEFNIPAEDTITHIDIYFPQINPPSSGKRIILSILSGLSGEARDVQRAQEFIITGGSSLNEFERFTLDIPLIVNGDFYVALQQFTNDYIGIGLDNNNLIGTQKIWVNTEGDWSRNLKVEGIVMIRPVFADSDYVVADIDRPESEQYSIYPNPANQILNIRGRFDYFELMNLSGQRMAFGYANRLMLSDFPDGIYFLKIQKDEQIEVHKIIIKH